MLLSMSHVYSDAKTRSHLSGLPFRRMAFLQREMVQRSSAITTAPRAYSAGWLSIRPILTWPFGSCAAGKESPVLGQDSAGIHLSIGVKTTKCTP